MKYLVAIFLVGVQLMLAGCSPNQRIVNSSAEREREGTTVNKNATPEVANVEADINAMRTADFNFIFVFRRKDGATLDAADRSFMNANIPYEINRKKLSDAGRSLVIGSNFRFPPENFTAMKERFAFEDYSKPESEIMAANSDANAK